jgi:hypothetical protein
MVNRPPCSTRVEAAGWTSTEGGDAFLRCTIGHADGFHRHRAIPFARIVRQADGQLPRRTVTFRLHVHVTYRRSSALQRR